MTTAGSVYGVLADVDGRECPNDSGVTIGRLALHLGSPSAVVVLGPHAELALAPRAIDEDFDIGAVAGLRHVELGHGRTVTAAADGDRERPLGRGFGQEEPWVSRCPRWGCDAPLLPGPRPLPTRCSRPRWPAPTHDTAASSAQAADSPDSAIRAHTTRVAAMTASTCSRAAAAVPSRLVGRTILS